MNIYLQVEVSVRELDSKLLLAVLAASRGHHVIISGMTEIVIGINNNILSPGIFHTKSLTPSKTKIDIHNILLTKGSKLTSIDEESGLLIEGYKQFAVDRYSKVTMDQASLVFGWGSEDTNTLKKIYSKTQHKIFMTGSPRIDLWNKSFSDFWVKPKKIPKKPFLLISSNIFCTQTMKFHNLIKFHKEAGYFERNTKLFKELFYGMAEDFQKLYEFIDAIKFLSKYNNGYEIVFRPHPSDNLEAWHIFLKDLPKVHIIREDSITAWVKYAFAIMHNGCTTALEASITGKPVLTFQPFAMKFDRKLFNKIGFQLKTKESLLKKTNEIFKSLKNKNQNLSNFYSKTPRIFTKKIHLDQNEYAASKILSLWENLDDQTLSSENSLIKFYLMIKFLNIKWGIRKILSKIYPNRFTYRENVKFAELDKKEISLKIERLKKILQTKKVKYKILSKRTIVIFS